MVPSSRIVENNIAKSSVDHGVPAQGVLEGSNVCNWTRDHSCDSVARNVAVLCLRPKNLPEAQPKRFELISLVEEILRHSSIDRDIYSCSLLCRSTAKKNKWGRNK